MRYVTKLTTYLEIDHHCAARSTPRRRAARPAAAYAAPRMHAARKARHTSSRRACCCGGGFPLLRSPDAGVSWAAARDSRGARVVCVRGMCARAHASVQETTSLFALLWRARVTRHAHAASHAPSGTAGEHDTPTPVLVRPRGRAPTSESDVREHTSHSWCSSRTTRTRTKIKHTQMTTKAAFFGRIRLN